MDIKYKNEFEFLDLAGLDDRTRVEINVALNSGAPTEVLQLPWDTGEENDYYETDTASSVDHGDNQSWQSYGTEHSQVSYENEMEGSGSGVIPTIQSAHIYASPPPQMVTALYGRMVIAQPNMYEMGPDMGLQQYIHGVDLQQQMYLPPTDIHDGQMSRDNRRRNHRPNKGNKRETNSSRYVDSGNEMVGGYHQQQSQYQRSQRHMGGPTVYYQTEHPNTQRQRAYYPGATQFSQSVPRPVYNQIYTPGIGNQYPRHPPVQQTPRHRPEIPKHNVKRINEPSPRPTASNYGPPPLSIQRKTTETVNNSQTNIDCVTTVIVNNSKITEHSVNDGNEGRPECTAATTTTTTTTTSTTKYSSNNNKIIDNSDSNSNISNKVPPVNLTIEHNIVATVNNKACELSEKAEGGGCPCVNINSSIQVKQKTENNVEVRKETVSVIQATVSEVEKESTAKEEPREEIPLINAKDVVVESKEPEAPTPQFPITPTINATTRPADESSGRSWASLLRKSDDETSPAGITNGKPTARINPLRIDVPASSDSENSIKFNSSPNEAPGTRQQTQGKPRAFSSVDHTGNDNVIQNRSEHQEEFNSSNKFDDLDAHKTGEFLLTYQMEKQTVSLLPRGLINRNNYCYINSILQALLACPPFYNLLVALPYSKTPSRNNASNNLTTNMIRFVHEFSPLSAGARLTRKDRPQKRSDEAVVNVQSGIAFEPSYVYTMLKNTSCASVFSVEGRQEDAEEFLSCLLNGISDEMLEMMKLANNKEPPIPAESEPPQSNHGGEQEEWKIMGPKNKGSITRCTDFGRTPLSDIFRGQLRYRVSRAGEQPTDNVQPFFTLQLDIEKAESVKGALEILVGKDQLEGMTCSKTKREIEAWKQVTLEELPVILILHLKWFDYKLDGCSKILKSVEFPIDLKIDGKILTMNTSKKLSPRQKQYKLFAVTYHDGKEATKGHYVTDAFHVGYGSWVRYDDSSLRGVSEHNVLNPLPPRVPYLLYYRRCDTIGNNQLNNDRIR